MINTLKYSWKLIKSITILVGVVSYEYIHTVTFH